ncbi:SPX domain-containing protein 4-like [Pyrus x bretschneideri]|uniref:SPX domain-containing protein 4-like n=1 Tax=Pyrus x bretschneideri TaxID=225117 RepID=UPI00202EDC04|nr:SPX domain-containing protein 4-like [Pyrus x bretschneideri]
MKLAKFRRTHLEETLPEWRDKFLCYKLLKKLLKHLPATVATIAAVDSLPRHLEFLPANAHLAVADGSGEFHPLGELFVPILNEELKKLNDFYVDKKEEFVIRFQELKGRIESIGERSSSGGVFTSETFRKEVMDIRKDFVTIHGEMVLLEKHSWWNFRALVKILKKYGKRTGGVLRLRFTQLDHQPLFTTETLTRLVRECEATLELPFPLEAEVIEGTTTTQDSTPPDRSHSNPQSNDSANIASETPSNMEANINIYRGTVAAMKAIQGLQKPSSTAGPWSLSNHFRSQDEESTGAVKVEISTSNSVASWQSEEEDDQL